MSPETWSLIISYATRVVGVVVLIFAASLVAKWAAKLVGVSCAKAGLDSTLQRFVSKLTRWVIMLLAVVMCLGAFGVETTSFAAVIGAAGLAIGLAFQGTLANLAAGVMLLIFRPFKVGDFVDIGGRRGSVDAIDIFFTTLDTPDNRRLILPNSQVFGAAIENVTYHDVRRVDIVVGTDYGADLDQTRQVLQAAGEGVAARLSDRPVQVVLTGLGASSIDWEVRIWSKREDFLGVAEAGRRDVKLALDGAGIGIPFPQMDVHLDGSGTEK